MNPVGLAERRGLGQLGAAVGDGKQNAGGIARTDRLTCVAEGDGRVLAPGWIAHKVAGLKNSADGIAVTACENKHVLRTDVPVLRVAMAWIHTDQDGHGSVPLGVLALSRLRTIARCPTKVNPLDALVAGAAPWKFV